MKALFVALIVAAPAIALGQSVDEPRTWSGPIFVTEADILTCPYHEIGDVEANVHSNTIFGKRPNLDKVVKEMRERGAKIHADAIVHAAFSPEHSTMVWGRVVTGTGKAVQFVDKACAPR